MKYMVMECHEGYAVLMDEDSRFVKAANLNYSVGQTVTDPILMTDAPRSSVITHSAIIRVTAAAACAALVCLGGFQYYNKNMKTDSVMTIGSDIKIEMELNSRGKVIALHSDSRSGKELLKNYKVKSKDSIEAANELLKVQIDQGYISDGDTVDLYITAPNSDKYVSYKSELEEKLSDLDVKLNVQDPADPPKPPTPPDKPPTPPAPEDGNEPPKPPAADDNKPVPGEAHPEPPKPGDDGETPPKPPVPPKGEPADKPGDEPAEPPVPADPPKVPDAPDPVKPPVPAPAPHHHEPQPDKITPPDPPQPIAEAE